MTVFLIAAALLLAAALYFVLPTLLRQTAVVMMEVLFEPLYEGQADFRELLNFMADQGFRFIEFADERRLPPLGKLVYADGVFLNEQLATLRHTPVK